MKRTSFAIFCFACVVVVLVGGFYFSPREMEEEKEHPNGEVQFRTTAFLNSSTAFPAKLTMIVQNVSQADVLIFNDVDSINVPCGKEGDDLNEAHYDYGRNPNASFIQISGGASATLSALADHGMEEMVSRAMKIRVPIRYKLSLDGEEKVTLMTFIVQRKGNVLE